MKKILFLVCLLSNILSFGQDYTLKLEGGVTIKPKTLYERKSAHYHNCYNRKVEAGTKCDYYKSDVGNYVIAYYGSHLVIWDNVKNNYDLFIVTEFITEVRGTAYELMRLNDLNMVKYVINVNNDGSLSFMGSKNGKLYGDMIYYNNNVIE